MYCSEYAKTKATVVKKFPDVVASTRLLSNPYSAYLCLNIKTIIITLALINVSFICYMNVHLNTIKKNWIILIFE